MEPTVLNPIGGRPSLLGPVIEPCRNPPRRYGKQVIYESNGEIGPIQVLEDRLKRSLHFGGVEKQSEMLLKEPDRLTLNYTQAMMSALLLMPPPKRVLMLGLGGGSMPKFLRRHFPEVTVDIVECSEEVLRIAVDLFHLPLGKQVRVFVADARDFMKRQKAGGYDLILMDLFDQFGPSRSSAGLQFYQDCNALLATQGAIVINFWTYPIETFRHAYDCLQNLYREQILRIPAKGGNNQILVAFNHPVRFGDLRSMMPKAKELEQTMHVRLPEYLREMFMIQPEFFRP